MSVIAHWIEDAGISTVVIGLIREHLTIIRPPRALWVPFELGRPVGPPSNAEFQRRVLLAALEMLTQDASEAQLLDFAAEDPRSAADADWQAPAIEQSRSVKDEVDALAAHHAMFFNQYLRSSVGIAGMSISDCAAFVDELGGSEPTHSPRDSVSPVLMARYAIDDLKAYYLEAALANGSPNSTQTHQWLWERTRLGSKIQTLRRQWMNSDSGKLQFVGERFLIPHRWRI